MSNKEFFDKLENHPKLLERMKNLLRIVDGEGEDEIKNANLAEYAVADELQPLGKEILEDWGKRQVARANQNIKQALPKVSKHSKKN